MKGTRAALRYAKAVLKLAKENGKETEVNKDMILISETIENSKDLKTTLNNPLIKMEAKENVLVELFKKNVNNITVGVFHLLKENKRLELLQEIAKQYTLIYDYYKHIEVAKVTTAVPLTKELEEKVLKKVVELTGNKATIENVVNPDLLGGFVLRVGDVQYDASISNYLNELRKEFDHSDYIPKI